MVLIGDIHLGLVYLSGSPAEEHVSTGFGGKVKVGLTTIVGVIFVTIIIERNWNMYELSKYGSCENGIIFIIMFIKIANDKNV